MTRDLILIIISLFTWGAGEGMFIYFQSIYLQQFGADPVMIGAILGASGIAMCAVHIPAGLLTDRIGRRPMMWLSWFLGAIAALVMALATSLNVFVIGLILYGVTTFGQTPINAYVTGARGKLSVGRAVTLSSAAFNLGAVLGPTVGGLIGESVSLRAVYAISAVIFVFSTIIILMVRPQPLDHHSDIEKATHSRQNRRFIVYLGVVFIAVFALYVYQPLNANFLQNERGLSLASIGTLGSLGSLGAALIMLFGGQLGTGLGFILGQVLVGFSALFIWQGSSMWWYGAAYFMLGGYRLCQSLAIAHARPLIRPAEMGLAYGIVETIISGAYTLAPVLAGLLYNWQPVSIYPAAIGAILLSIVVSITFLVKNRTAAAETQPTTGSE